MPHPRLTDDGSVVTLDLHGARVDEAVRLVHALVRVAGARGRSSVRVIHGASTSDPRARNRTIKHALHDQLDRDALGGVTDVVRGEGELLLGLPVSGRRDPRRLRLPDLRS